MADKVMDDAETTILRLSCECLDPMHTVDLTVERLYPLGKDKGYSVSIEWVEKYRFDTLWERVVRAVKILRGKELWGHGFIMRNEDIPLVVTLLENALSAGGVTTNNWVMDPRSMKVTFSGEERA